METATPKNEKNPTGKVETTDELLKELKTINFTLFWTGIMWCAQYYEDAPFMNEYEGFGYEPREALLELRTKYKKRFSDI